MVVLDLSEFPVLDAGGELTNEAFDWLHSNCGTDWSVDDEEITFLHDHNAEHFESYWTIPSDADLASWMGEWDAVIDISCNFLVWATDERWITGDAEDWLEAHVGEREAEWSVYWRFAGESVECYLGFDLIDHAAIFRATWGTGGCRTRLNNQML